MNFPTLVELVMTQSDDHINMRLILQLISDISKVLQKLLKYLNGTNILATFVLPSALVFLDIFTLNLNDSESAKVAFGSCL